MLALVQYKTLVSTIDLREHMASVHEENKAFQCEICD